MYESLSSSLHRFSFFFSSCSFSVCSASLRFPPALFLHSSLSVFCPPLSLFNIRLSFTIFFHLSLLHFLKAILFFFACSKVCWLFFFHSRSKIMHGKIPFSLTLFYLHLFFLASFTFANACSAFSFSSSSSPSINFAWGTTHVTILFVIINPAASLKRENQLQIEIGGDGRWPSGKPGEETWC